MGDPPECSSQDMRKGAQSDNTLLVLFFSMISDAPESMSEEYILIK